MNQIKLALLAAIASLFLASYAVALESREAAIVADVLETLASERGEPVYYDEEAADDWYEFDADGDGLIPAAGFTRESWQVAYEQTLKGLIALTPQSEFDAMFGNVEEKVAALQGLTAEQKRELAGDFMAEAERVQAYRAEGAAFAEAVRPVAGRLRALGDQ